MHNRSYSTPRLTLIPDANILMALAAFVPPAFLRRQPDHALRPRFLDALVTLPARRAFRIAIPEMIACEAADLTLAGSLSALFSDARQVYDSKPCRTWLAQHAGAVDIVPPAPHSSDAASAYMRQLRRALRGVSARELRGNLMAIQRTRQPDLGEIAAEELVRRLAPGTAVLFATNDHAAAHRLHAAGAAVISLRALVLTLQTTGLMRDAGIHAPTPDIYSELNRYRHPSHVTKPLPDHYEHEGRDLLQRAIRVTEPPQLDTLATARRSGIDRFLERYGAKPE